MEMKWLKGHVCLCVCVHQREREKERKRPKYVPVLMSISAKECVCECARLKCGSAHVHLLLCYIVYVRSSERKRDRNRKSLKNGNHKSSSQKIFFTPNVVAEEALSLFEFFLCLIEKKTQTENCNVAFSYNIVLDLQKIGSIEKNYPSENFFRNHQK